MSSTRKYKCPYCEKRFIRENLVGHIERNHIDILPEGFTPLQLTYHTVNKRDIKYKRPCRICHNPTEWDEKKGRYNFLCGKKSCHDSWVKQMEENMHGEMGKHRPTSSPEGLKKMLANRRISGKYQWSDKTIKVFTGSNEKNTLKFLDKIILAKSEEVMCPGPVLKYTLDGKEHMYITDIYYIPYHLIIEVKDGGNNPNTNPSFSETRRKTLAKEEYVINHTDYNYLRLTDNDFSQLLSIFADLKMNLLEDNDNKRSIHVNEASTGMTSGPMIGMNDIIIVNYGGNNVFSSNDLDFAIANNPKFDKLFFRNSFGELEQGNYKFLENKNYTVYHIRDIKKKVSNELMKHIGEFIPEGFIYELVFDHPCYSYDQILFENNVEEIQDYYKDLNRIQETVKDAILNKNLRNMKM